MGFLAGMPCICKSCRMQSDDGCVYVGVLS